MRKAGPQDAEQILRMLCAYYKENQEIMPVDVDFDLEDSWAFLKNALQSESLIGHISEDGVVLGRLTHPWFGKTPMALGLLWYVRPKARNGILARNLMRAYDKEAKERGAKYSRLELDNPAHIKVIGPLMQKFGYDDHSRIYFKRFECSTSNIDR